MQRRRYYAWLAVIGSVTLHFLLAPYVSNAIRLRTHTGSTSPEPISVRIAVAPQHRLESTNISAKPQRQHSRSTTPSSPPSRMSADEHASTLQATSTARIPSPAEPPASNPSTEEILRRITDGALSAAKSYEARRQIEKPWLKASQPEQGHTSSAQTALGGRVERVHSAAGTYCVVTPNAATAYRNSNGVNIAGVSNCP